jgi:hypothetical protein
MFRLVYPELRFYPPLRDCQLHLLSHPGDSRVAMRDGNLITGQQQFSGGAAELVVKALVR